MIGYFVSLFFAVSIFFNLCESAVLSANLSKIKQLESDGDVSALNLLKLRTTRKSAFNIVVRSVSTFCSFCTSAITIKLIYPEVMSALIMFSHRKYFGAERMGVAILIVELMSILFVLNCCIIPRKIGTYYCEQISYRVSGIMIGIIWVLYLYCLIMDFIGNIISKIFGVPTDSEEKLATEDEILMMVDASGEKGVIEESEADMIANIFEFGDITASEAMTHRTDVCGLEYTVNVMQAVDFAMESGFSRIPVYKGDMDNIQGVLYVKDLLKFIGNSEKCSTPVYHIMRPACYIPETKRLSELFGEMTETKVQMAVVVDEYGGTSGIITMEDLIESILGNIQDEFDNEDEEISQVNDTTFTIDGTTSIYEVSDLLNIEIPEGDYDTLAGYIVSTLGRIPGEKEHPILQLDNYEFRVDRVIDRRVSRVHVEKIKGEDFQNQISDNKKEKKV